MKYLLVISRYNDIRQDIFERFISPKNKAYCYKHGIEYLLIDNSIDIKLYRDNPTWWKFSIPKALIDNGFLKEGDLLSHFDADMVMCKPEFEYTTSKSFSYAIDNGNTHCMGNYCMRINDWTIDLVNRILDEDLYQKHKDTNHWREFREQAAWYSLAGITPHSDVSFFYKPFYGFNEFLLNSNYSIKELMDHVEIKDPRWNTTLLSEEADNPIAQMLQQYNINKTPKNETIIRHFAGGQTWREEYFL